MLTLNSLNGAIVSTVTLTNLPYVPDAMWYGYNLNLIYAFFPNQGYTINPITGLGYEFEINLRDGKETPSLAFDQAHSTLYFYLEYSWTTWTLPTLLEDGTDYGTPRVFIFNFTDNNLYGPIAATKSPIIAMAYFQD